MKRNEPTGDHDMQGLLSDAGLKALAEAAFSVEFLEANMRALYSTRAQELLGQTNDIEPMVHCYTSSLGQHEQPSIPMPVNQLETSLERRVLATAAGTALGEEGLDISYLMFEVQGWQSPAIPKENADEVLNDPDRPPVSMMDGARETLLISGTTVDGRCLTLIGEIKRVGSDSIDEAGQGPVLSVGKPEMMGQSMDHILDALRVSYLKARCEKIRKDGEL
jgi:hypothetical protein